MAKAAGPPSMGLFHLHRCRRAGKGHGEIIPQAAVGNGCGDLPSAGRSGQGFDEGRACKIDGQDKEAAAKPGRGDRVQAVARDPCDRRSIVQPYNGSRKHAHDGGFRFRRFEHPLQGASTGCRPTKRLNMVAVLEVLRPEAGAVRWLRSRSGNRPKRKQRWENDGEGCMATRIPGTHVRRKKRARCRSGGPWKRCTCRWSARSTRCPPQGPGVPGAALRARLASRGGIERRADGGLLCHGADRGVETGTVGRRGERRSARPDCPVEGGSPSRPGTRG